MSTYRMDDGTIVNTDNATMSWKEDTYFDGCNMISKATGSQWEHQALHKSRKGRYYIEHWSQWRGLRGCAEWVSKRTAASWLYANNHEIPEDLKAAVEDVTE